MKHSCALVLLVIGVLAMAMLACGTGNEVVKPDAAATQIALGVQGTLTASAPEASKAATVVVPTQPEDTATPTSSAEAAATATSAPAATRTAEPEPTAEPTLAPSATPSAGLSNQNWDLALTDADRYKDEPVRLTGRIFLPPEVSAEVVGFQIYTTAGLTDGNTIVVGPSGLKVKEDDYVQVEGKLEGMFEGENLFGATLRVPRVVADKVTVVGRNVAIPPVKTYDVNQSINQHGLTITLERVEVADPETRLYVKVQNGSKYKAYLFTSDANLVQGNKQFEPKITFDTSSPELPSDILPGIEAEGVILFDPVNAEESLKFIWEDPHLDNYSLDFVPFVWQIAAGGAAQASTSTTGGPSIVVGDSAVNVRSGPGTGYAAIGKAAAGQQYAITGKNADNSWWQINLAGKPGWVAASVVRIVGGTDAVPVAKDIPKPPPPKPTAPPVVMSKTMPLGQEFLTTLWGVKLYDVKRAKAVYWYGDGEIAHGTWLIPLVEFRNLGSGTNDPHSNLHFYLQDDKGRTFTYDPFNDGVLGAAWQFQAGHLYDDINPGSALGVALPFDVSPDLGDMWLRVKEAPNVVMYLGNVSQMPETK
jgi:hypothetical protein